MRTTAVALLSSGFLLTGCISKADDVWSADQMAADEAIATVENSLQNQGFTVDAGEDGRGDAGSGAISAGCENLDIRLLSEDERLPGETARATSATFLHGNIPDAVRREATQETVTAVVWFVEEGAAIDPMLDLLHDERTKACLRQELRGDFTASELGALKVLELGSGGLGDHGRGLTVLGEVTPPGFTVPFTITMQFVRDGRAIVGVGTATFGPSDPTADRAAIVEALLDAVHDQAV